MIHMGEPKFVGRA